MSNIMIFATSETGLLGGDSLVARLIVVMMFAMPAIALTLSIARIYVACMHKRREEMEKKRAAELERKAKTVDTRTFV